LHFKIFFIDYFIQHRRTPSPTPEPEPPAKRRRVDSDSNAAPKKQSRIKRYLDLAAEDSDEEPEDDEEDDEETWSDKGALCLTAFAFD
jgi:hypothetical protein